MIKLENVSCGYKNKAVLHHINLVIEKGKVTTVIGANGSGKTTLLKTIVGILSPISGNITVDGKDISVMKSSERAKAVSYLSQGKSVPDMTVESLVLHGRFPHLSYPARYSEKDRRTAFEAMKDLGIDELADAPLNTLSGGMRQSAYIAMALCQNTGYILLDEPATYLDISGQIKLMNTIKRLAQNGKGIITVMHDLPCAFTFSDSICVMKNGELVMCDCPYEVYSSGILKEVFGEELNLSHDDKGYYYNYKNV